ncbi:MAG: hypothetical protein ACRCU3_09520 [Eubacteriaceae bacterium]
MLKTGLRRSALFALTWDNIDFEKKSLSVESSAEKKTKYLHWEV